MPRKNPESPQSLEAKQVLALSHLLQGHKPAAVARQLDVSRSTVWRWLQNPEFAEALAELQRDLTGDARKQMRNLVRDAVDELSELMRCDDPKVRLAAVNSVLDRAGLRGEDPEKPSGAAELLKQALSFGEAFVLSQAQAMTTSALRGGDASPE